MGELIESDPELYQADIEKKTSLFDPQGSAPGRGMASSGDPAFFDAIDQLYDADSDDSFMDEDEQSARVKQRKAAEVKLNNSYTGPYPQDPTDFNHTDKGPNAQFLHFLHNTGASNSIFAGHDMEEEKEWRGQGVQIQIWSSASPTLSQLVTKIYCQREAVNLACRREIKT